MPHKSGNTNYKSTKAHPKPMMAATKPAAAGSRTAPSSKASPMAMQRSHGQRGAEMKAAHAAPKATTGGGRKMYPGGSKHFDESGGGGTPRTGMPTTASKKPIRVGTPGARGKRKV